MTHSYDAIVEADLFPGICCSLPDRDHRAIRLGVAVVSQSQHQSPNEGEQLHVHGNRAPTPGDPELIARSSQVSLRTGVGSFGERLVNDLSYVMLSSEMADAQQIVLDDVRLVKQIAAGEAAALGRFYDKWSAQVYATVIAIVRTSQDAEEIVDDCFWQAWNQASRFDPSRGQVRSWILNIARSRALDRLKAVNRRREDELDAAPAELFATPSDAEERLDEETRATQVAFALKVLPSAQREVLEMAYYGGLSQTEIANSTGEALGTVKTRIRLGMQKLRETLGPMERSSS